MTIVRNTSRLATPFATAMHICDSYRLPPTDCLFVLPALVVLILVNLILSRSILLLRGSG